MQKAPLAPHSTPVSTRRYLSLRHAKHVIKAQESHGVAYVLPSGQEQLFSSEIPGLQGGDYVISATQVVHHKEDDRVLDQNPKPSEQQFHVQAPRFSLPEDAIYSKYPPPGQEANHDVLPHIVFNHATMPWENQGSLVFQGDDRNRNRVPWLALLTFTADELSNTPDQVKSFFSDSAAGKSNYRQNDTLSVTVSLKDIVQLNADLASGPRYGDTDFQDATSEKASLIFVQAKLFNDLFSAYKDDGERDTTPKPDMSRHRFLSHLRSINTQGMAVAGETEDTPKRDFGVIVSNRCAPSYFEQPTAIYVHLVSLERLEDIQPWPVPTNNASGTERRVALLALDSWVYTCLPPTGIDVKTRLENLGKNVFWMQPNLKTAPEMPDTPVKKRALQRIADGFSMVRYRSQTGEETVAFTRGPLIPVIVDKREGLQSNSGENLRIMDKEVGIMDISYSVAWQLGRTMALADRAFTTALTRVRRQITSIAQNEARVKLLRAAGRPHLSRLDLVGALPDAMGLLQKLSHCEASVIGDQQWKQPETDPVDLSYRSPGMSYFLEDELGRAASLVASTTDVRMGRNADDPPPPYNELNTPFSVDWMVVLKFVLDLYHLVNVPAHYLITDSSHVPEESIRFFIIDQNWINALVDGALSLGNHVDPQADITRAKIKDQIKEYLKDKDPRLNYEPPVPRFGFFMRSEIVTKFPDLKVEMRLDGDKSAGDPLLLRHEIISKDVMLGFFSQRPITQGVSSLTFTLPSHQQYFSVGYDFDQTHLKLQYKRICSSKGVDTSTPTPISSPIWQRDQKGTDDRPVIYKWGHTPKTDDIRLLLVDKLALDVHDTLIKEWPKQAHPEEWKEKHATAAMMGIQLNAPALQLQVKLPTLGQLPGPFPDAFPSGPLPVLSQPTMLDVAKYPEKIATQSTSSLEDRTKLPAIRQDDVVPPHYTRVVGASLLDGETPVSRTGSVSSFVRISPSPWGPLLHVTEGVPEFKYAVWPAKSPQAGSVQMLDTRQDLIFSVVRGQADDAAQFRLRSLTLWFWHHSSDKDEHGLLDDEAGYEGVSATMVSNLRFNVRIAYSRDDNRLLLRLLPRSRNRWVRVADIQELSVLLSRVKVKKYDKPTDITVTAVTEYVDALSPDVPFKIKLV
ncbi:hypothetical protein AYL99_03688 [Fonsecaea erecta]|uniref:Uncharacterized protein n=1 Tax=Fonsecaea erecta TaxID=1367422 RepID=A0A178ZR59_9EURO|nr:hypothetical protein AYL99_03688 [Fonsecaea erecta]OAP61485.1 hypothetical protein AYL99_03688 [Fonsecaea erecta]